MGQSSGVVWARADVTGAVRAWSAQPEGAPPGDRPRQLVVFLPGFVTAPTRYRQLLAAVAATGPHVLALQLYRPSPAVFAGRFGADDEARAAARIVDGHRTDTDEIWLVGHSRGGQAAWLAAAIAEPDGLVVIDPVDGAGRNPSQLHAASQPAAFRSRTLVVGAGRGGRCAPAAVNHEHFARVGPPGAAHVVVDEMGHGDVLDDRAASMARRLCGGSDRPAAERATVATLVTAFLDDDLGSDVAELPRTPTAITAR